MKKTILIMAMLAAGLHLAPDLFAANSFTLAVTPGTTVTMGDASALIPVTITNTGNTDYIGFVRISVDAGIYYVSNNTPAPAGWQLTFPVTNGAGQAFAEFSVIDPTDPKYRIDPGESLIFSVAVTGSKTGSDYPPIYAAAADTIDYVLDTCNTPSKASEARKSKTGAAFPQGGTCSATCAAGNIQDCFVRKALYGSMNASPSAVGSNGTIIVNFTITNRSSTSPQATIRPASDSLTVNGVGATAACSGPTPASASNLNQGESATFQWVCTASGNGSLQFCNSARNGSGNATSVTVCSNTVAVGDFTGSLSISPNQVITGQDVTVLLQVTNNGTSSRQTITPSVLTFQQLSGNVASNCSGPTPGSVGNIGPGVSAIFQWTCTITSTQVGSTFRYSVYAVDGNGQGSNPNPSYSNTGTVSAYSVTGSPATSYYLNTNVPFVFTVRNGGGYPVTYVKISTPDNGFLYSAASGGCGVNWAAAQAGPPAIVTFDSGGCTSCASLARCIPCTTGECSFTITYASLPNVSQNVNSSTDFNFKVDLWDTATPTNKDPRASIGVIFRITKNNITIMGIPDTVNPGCTSELVATVTPPVPNGSVVSFGSTGGTLSNITTTTTSTVGGVGTSEACATLQSLKPYNLAIPTATVTASYQDVSSSATIIYPNAAECGNVQRFRWQEVVQ